MKKSHPSKKALMKRAASGVKAANLGGPGLLGDIRRMIEEARSAVAVTVNAGLTMLYWRIGKRINEEILKGGRATYGEQIVHALSAQLQTDYGRGFAKRNLRRSDPHRPGSESDPGSRPCGPLRGVDLSLQ